MLRWDMAFDPYQLIDKKTRKALTRRNDRIGLMHLGGHFAAIGVGGYRDLPHLRHDLHAARDVAARHRARLPVRSHA